MNILALDTSTQICSVALVKDGAIDCEINIRVVSGHAGMVLPVIDQAITMSTLDRDSIDLIAVGTGPGSFTGIRIGMATAKGLAKSFNCPIKGVNTLDIIASASIGSGRPVFPVVDARKGEIFCALYSSDGTRQTPYMNILPEKTSKIITEETIVTGNALDLYGETFSQVLGKNFVSAPDHRWHPSASITASMAVMHGVDNPSPVYVRESDAEITLRKSR